MLPQESEYPDDIVELIHSTEILDKSEELKQPAILCPRNASTFEVNDIMINRIEGECKSYCNVDSVVSDYQNEIKNFPAEFLNRTTLSGMPRHELKVKVGAIIMLLRIFHPAGGLRNNWN